MAVTLGKRKRRGEDEEGKEENEFENEEDMRARFQRAFEAKFKPLTEPVKAVPVVASPEESEVDSEDSDWDGFSGDEHDVEVVEHAQAGDDADGVARLEMRSFMSTKPPSNKARTSGTPKPGANDDKDDAGEASNLKHDLALQRLLKESHLLDPSTFSGAAAAPEGKGRLKALDLRLQGLGAKQAASEQQKMPLAHRKGITAKAASRETSRRKEAAENGVILERAKLAPKVEKRRERSVATPTVGKFKGGTLNLSSKDVRSIQGPKQKAGGKGRRK